MNERRKLPDTRQSLTHRFAVGSVHGYIIVGFYEDGTPGEVFVKMAKEGSTLSGLLDGWAVTTSIALQYGVPLEAIITKLARMRFEPSGFTGQEGINYAASIYDYVARWIGQKFLSAAVRASLPPGDGPLCPECGVPQEDGQDGVICRNCQNDKHPTLVPIPPGDGPLCPECGVPQEQLQAGTICRRCQERR